MDKSDWQGGQGDSWAQEWRRTDRSFGQVTECLLGKVRGLHFSHVLDIGCGAGELSLAIARGHPDAKVTGVDISPQLVAVASDRGTNLANTSFACSDAGSWSPQGEPAPDLLVSRHGVMFFDDPVAAFGNLSRLAATQARLIFSCFRSPSQNPFFTDILALLPDPPAAQDPRAPGPFAFADRDYVSGILLQAGWTDLLFEPVDFPMVTGAGPDPIEDAVEYFGRIGPAAKAIAQLQGDQLEGFLDGVRSLAKRNSHEGIVALPAAAWIVSGRKS